MELISVVMGVYNCENRIDLVEQSVKSIINQTYKNWELIICNDGSTDETYKYLKQIAKLDSRIRVISYNKNRGRAYAANFGIKHARGNYIARQDDDDISYPNRLEKEIEYLKNHKEIGFVGSNADVYNSNEGIWGELIVPETPTKNSFLWNSPFIQPTIMFRKESLDLVDGYRVKKETRRCEDYDLFMRLYAKGIRGYNIQQNLCRYKVENSSKKYRSSRDRVEEMKVRLYGFKEMNIGIKRVPYVIKPILVGLIPQFIFRKIKEKQYGQNK